MIEIEAYEQMLARGNNEGGNVKMSLDHFLARNIIIRYPCDSCYVVPIM